jgi:hypothetical protein
MFDDLLDAYKAGDTDRVLCNRPDWQLVAGPRHSLLFYPVGATIPSPKDEKQ